MKRTLRLAIALCAMSAALGVAAPSASSQTGFCAGFADGYGEGYCYQRGMCMRPMTPMCPMQRMGESTYQDGYNRGFAMGMAAQRR